MMADMPEMWPLNLFEETGPGRQSSQGGDQLVAALFEAVGLPPPRPGVRS